MSATNLLCPMREERPAASMTAAMCGARNDVVEHGSMRAGLAEQPEHQRDCKFWDFVEHVEPAEVGQCRIEFGAGGRDHSASH